jgi:hypothetical protein
MTTEPMGLTSFLNPLFPPVLLVTELMSFGGNH